MMLGSWELIKYSTRSDNGAIDHPLGVEASGMIMYSPDGFMSVQIMSRERARFATSNVHRGTASELHEAVLGYIAYSGPFEVDEQNSIVWHRVALSLYPNWVGDAQKRFASVQGNQLTLTSAPLRFRTTTLHPTLVWRRPLTSGHGACADIHPGAQ